MIDHGGLGPYSETRSLGVTTFNPSTVTDTTTETETITEKGTETVTGPTVTETVTHTTTELSTVSGEIQTTTSVKTESSPLLFLPQISAVVFIAIYRFRKTRIRNK